MPSMMTPLCGFGLGEGGDSNAPAPVMSTLRFAQIESPTNGATVVVADNGNDVVLMLNPAGPLNLVAIALPQNGSNLQILRIISMQDILDTQFTGGTVLNGPSEMLANQSVSIQRINSNTNKWVAI